MTDLPIPHNLPSALFLVGGSQEFRTLVANTYSDLIPRAQAHSFSAPIRDGALGTFFSGDPSIDIAALHDHPIFAAPDSPTFGAFVTAYSQFLAAFFSDPAITGKLASRAINENLQYFSHFVFDDADVKENIRVIADLVGRDKSAIVNFASPGLTSRSIRVIDLPPVDNAIEAIRMIFSAIDPASQLCIVPPQPTPSIPNDLTDLA